MGRITQVQAGHKRSCRPFPEAWNSKVGPDYICYQLSNDGVEFKMLAHRAVAEAFLGSRPFPGAVVRHLDGDSLHNHYTNLAWGSYRDNKQDDRRLGTLMVGERVWTSKLTADDVLAMRHLIREHEKARWLFKHLQGCLYG
jgi:hypothetical protein